MTGKRAPPRWPVSERVTRERERQKQYIAARPKGRALVVLLESRFVVVIIVILLRSNRRCRTPELVCVIRNIMYDVDLKHYIRRGGR